jgi:hypothetical protein
VTRTLVQRVLSVWSGTPVGDIAVVGIASPNHTTFWGKTVHATHVSAMFAHKVFKKSGVTYQGKN